MVSHEPFPEPQRVALAYAPVRFRPAWRALVALDLRLGAIVSTGREPMLAQIRLAWWRDMLGRPVGEWPEGEPLLDQIATHMAGEAERLAELPWGWEQLLADGPLQKAQLREYVAVRASAYGGIQAFGGQSAVHPDAGLAATWWVLGDTLARLSRPEERAAVVEIARSTDPHLPALPRAWRPLSVLAALGRRAVVRNEPVMEGRGGALAALRAGLFGR